MTLTGEFGTACRTCIDSGRLPAGWHQGTGVVGGEAKCDNCGRRRWACVTVQRTPRDPGKPPAPPANPSNVTARGHRDPLLSVCLAFLVGLVIVTPLLYVAFSANSDRDDCTRISLTIDGRARDYVPSDCR